MSKRQKTPQELAFEEALKKFPRQNRLTDQEIEEIKREARRQRVPIYKKRYGKKKFPARHASEYINTGQAPRILNVGSNNLQLDDGRIVQSDQIFRNRERTRGLKKPAEETQETWRHKQDRMLRNWAAETGRGHGTEEWHSIIHRCVTGRYKIFFYADKWMMVEFTENWESEVRRSKVYPSKETLITAFKLGIAFDP